LTLKESIVVYSNGRRVYQLGIKVKNRILKGGGELYNRLLTETKNFLKKETKMRNKKVLLSIICVVILLLTLVCGSSYAATAIKYATSASVNNITLTTIEGGGLSSEHTAAVVFKRIVEKRTDGKLKIRIYPNNQLGAEAEQIQSVQQGIIQMTSASCSTLASFVPEWMAFTIPYSVQSPRVFYKVLEGPVGREFKELVAKKIGVRILAWAFLGFRNFTLNEPVHNINDLKGKKIRVIETPDMVKMVEGLGAQAVPINWAELYSALQQGVVDGEENPLSMVEEAKLYEVQKYMIMDGHRCGVIPIMINEKFYKSLSKEYQKIIKDAAMAGAAIYRGQVYLGNTLWVEDLTKKGMTIYYPTEKELAEFREATREPVESWVRSQIGDEWVDKVKKALKEAENLYYR